MQAIIYREYGSADVLQLSDVSRPIPNADQVLINVYVTALNAADWRLMTGKPLPLRFMTGLFKPKQSMLGTDIAGIIEAVGRNVTQFKVGDAVLGNIWGSGASGLSQYICVPEHMLVLKPANVSFEQAAATPMAAVTALQGLRQGHIAAGQNVLIYGASGGAGTFAVQLAKHFGATVTAVASAAKHELMRSLGADQVLDYAKDDFASNGQRYDLILGVNGYRSIFSYKRSLTPKGRYVMLGGDMSQIFQALALGKLLSIGSTKQLSNLTAKTNQADLAKMSFLLANGDIKAVIDRSYPLAEAPAAMRYLQAGHAKGKILIKLHAEQAVEQRG
ncbi:NAD(P)-dependent alcohol dehydrogenase [Herpetosiphon geysericola]|uniref:Alcohol dehydrogenase n=1 Tax=Herpetosiphon geysericola TaxID=70996 RepID=A0A0P6YFQ2_9CHLR|nr:NAD(P)-dependent alcohol dehydrogenase [Herpetosiphon geysericola]KPL91006.1 alcohol dehydrogenase [Herpetosiphon geysericola]